MINELQNTIQKKKGFLTFELFRDLLVCVLLVVVTLKLLTSDISVSLGEFSFTDLLSMLLAFFAIGLSVLFYFKATDTSNVFYDNTYKFTKDISEILGRIEAGFGEKLSHIEEGNNGLRDKVERMSSFKESLKEDEEVHLEETEKEKNQMIEEVLEKAKIANEEKEAFRKKLRKVDIELQRSREELARLKSDSAPLTDEMKNFGFYLIPRAKSLLSDRSVKAISPLSAKKLSDCFVREYLSNKIIFTMQDFGFLDESRELT